MMVVFLRVVVLPFAYSSLQILGATSVLIPSFCGSISVDFSCMFSLGIQVLTCLFVEFFVCIFACVFAFHSYASQDVSRHWGIDEAVSFFLICLLSCARLPIYFLLVWS